MKRFLVFFFAVHGSAVAMCGGGDRAIMTGVAASSLKRPLRSRCEPCSPLTRKKVVSFSEEVVEIGYVEKSESDVDTDGEIDATVAAFTKDEKPDYKTQMKEWFDNAKACAAAVGNQEPLKIFLEGLGFMSQGPRLSESDREVLNTYKKIVSHEMLCFSFREMPTLHGGDDDEPISGEAFETLLKDVKSDPLLLDNLLTQFSSQSSQHARLSEARKALDLV